MLLSEVLHVLPTQFSKNNITRRTAYGIRDYSPSYFMYRFYVCLLFLGSVFRLTFPEMWLSMLFFVFAVAQILSIWVPHFKICSMTVPRCLWCLTRDIGSSKKNKLWDSGLPRKPRVISYDLNRLNVTSHWFAYSSIIFRSADNISSFLPELLLEM